MSWLSDVKAGNNSILVVGADQEIIQSIMDFDYLSGKDQPSIVGIVTNSARFKKFFWGKNEILVPCFGSTIKAAEALKKVDWLLNLRSGRRSLSSTSEFFQSFPDAYGGHLFAEDTPEIHALKLNEIYQSKGKLLIGPAGVGLLLPGELKLGAIGGITSELIAKSRLNTRGNVAIISASGGMVNELINITTKAGKRVSFALCYGGDRFPLTSPLEAFYAAESDPDTELIIYYGELGGHDEYDIADAVKAKKIKKPIISYIAGSIGESFKEPIQFGHAKALARTADETAGAKQQAFAEAGIKVADSIDSFVSLIKKEKVAKVTDKNINESDLKDRKPSLFSSSISGDSGGEYAFVGKTLTDWSKEGDLVMMVISGLLGQEPKSQLTVKIAKAIFMLGLDHGPSTAGALNTIVTARAGKSLVDSLSAGLLTIGPRFGGAISAAASNWHRAVKSSSNAKDLVEDYASRGEYLPGIGHKKYRLDIPDPRTKALNELASELKARPHLDLAHAVEEITTSKKGNLILNFDGTVAALLLDVLRGEEDLSADQIELLIEADFFNSFFVIPRAIGLVSHHLDQKRLDEGLFRLPDDLVAKN